MRLIEQLGSDSIEEREKAETDLLEYGPAAISQLEAALGHQDPEVAARLRRVVSFHTGGWISELEDRVIMALGSLSGPSLERELEASMEDLEPWLTNPRALQLREDINRVSPCEHVIHELRGGFHIHLHQMAIEVARHIRKGQVLLFEQGSEKEALEQFLNAEFKIRAIPVEVRLLTDQLPAISNRIVQIRQGIER